MAQFKITYIFNACRYGWTETFYADKASRIIAAADALNVAITRCNLLQTPCVIDAVRITDLDHPNACSILPYPPLTPADIEPNDLADTPWNGWQVELMAGVGYCRQMILRGMADNWIKRVGANPCSFDLPTRFTDALNTWRVALVAKQFQLKVILQSGPGTAPINIGTTITSDGDGNSVFPITGLVGTPGKTVKFKSWVGPDKVVLNHVHTIVSNNGTQVAVNLPFVAITAPTGNSNGQAFAQITGYQQITGVQPVRVSGRKTGRAFFVRRGRRANRR